MRRKGGVRSSLGEERVSSLGVGTGLSRSLSLSPPRTLSSQQLPPLPAQRHSLNCPSTLAVYASISLGDIQFHESLSPLLAASAAVSSNQRRPSFPPQQQPVSVVTRRAVSSVCPLAPAASLAVFRAMLAIRRLANKFSKQTLSEVKVCVYDHPPHVCVGLIC